MQNIIRRVNLEVNFKSEKCNVKLINNLSMIWKIKLQFDEVEELGRLQKLIFRKGFLFDKSLTLTLNNNSK